MNYTEGSKKQQSNLQVGRMSIPFPKAGITLKHEARIDVALQKIQVNEYYSQCVTKDKAEDLEATRWDCWTPRGPRCCYDEFLLLTPTHIHIWYRLILCIYIYIRYFIPDIHIYIYNRSACVFICIYIYTCVFILKAWYLPTTNILELLERIVVFDIEF